MLVARKKSAYDGGVPKVAAGTAGGASVAIGSRFTGPLAKKVLGWDGVGF